MTDQTPAAKPVRKPKTSTEKNWIREAVVKATEASGGTAHKASLAGRPYTLESSTIANDIARYGSAARSEIEAIEADCLQIKTRANNDITQIRARADTEIAARRDRIIDLTKIVAMADAAVPPAAVERQAPQLTDRSEGQTDATV